MFRVSLELMRRARKSYYVYIMSNQSRTLYVGYTDNLIRRIEEHKNKKHEGFTKKYNVTKLVYFEKYDRPFQAEHREKQLKSWHRDWKLNLIKSVNKQWRDLLDDFKRDAETKETLNLFLGDGSALLLKTNADTYNII